MLLYFNVLCFVRSEESQLKCYHPSMMRLTKNMMDILDAKNVILGSKNTRFII